MADHIEIDVSGLAELEAALGTMDERSQAGLYKMLDDIRQRGEHYMRLYAPAYSGELLRRIGSSAPRPSIGPAGFEMESEIGVSSGPRYPLYVHGGTGIYQSHRGPFGALQVPSGDLIRAKRPGKPLTFQKQGEPRRFRQWVRGQRSNPFVLHAYQQLLPYAAGRVRRMFDGI